MSRTSRERWTAGRVRIAVTGLVALVALILAGQAWAHPYVASITPASAGTGDGNAYSYTVVDKYTGHQKATRLEITIPGGWGTPGVLTVSATGGTWNAPTVGSGKIVVTAASGGLSYNQSLTVGFESAATCTPGTSSWTPRLSGSSSSFVRSGPVPTVAVTKPGRLASFAWTTQPGASQKAGVAFPAAITAFDACGYVKTDYVGSHGSLSGLSTSPGFTAPPAASAVAGTAPSGLGAQTFSAGVASASVTGFAAETTSLSFVDGAVSSSASSSVTVAPGDLDRFYWTQQPGGQQQAGGQFTAAVTAYDAWGNVKTDYAGTGSLTGPGTSPNGTAPLGLGTQAFAAGVASVAVTDFRKESTTLTYGDASILAASNPFSVAAGPFSVAFATQPGNAVADQAIPSTTSGQPIEVAASDQWGNTPDDGSTIALAASPSVALAGTNPGQVTGGAAQFANLAIATPGTYQLVATLNAPGDGQNGVGPVNSGSFVISAASGVSCTAPCTAPSLTETPTGLTSTVATSGSGGTLNVSFLPSGSYCGAFTSIGSITNFEVFGGTAPSFDITWSVVFSNTLNPGLITRQLSAFDICLGTINTATGTGPGFRAKNGQTAQLQLDGFYWGLLANCGSVPSGNPCIYARSKVVITVNGVTNGKVTLKFRVPYPWDGRYAGG